MSFLAGLATFANLATVVSIGASVFSAFQARNEAAASESAARGTLAGLAVERSRIEAAGAEEARVTERRAKIRRSAFSASASGRGVTTSGSVIALLRDDFEETERELINQRFNTQTALNQNIVKSQTARIAASAARTQKTTGFFGSLLGGLSSSGILRA